MTSLSDIFAPTSVAGNEVVFSTTEDWGQGRGLFGGVVVGCLVRAIELLEPDPARVVRSLTAEIAGPVSPGPVRVLVEALRRGSAVSTVRARIEGTDEVLADLVAVLARARPGTPSWHEMPVPVMPPWRGLEPTPLAPPLTPTFTQNLEFRITGPLPFQGGTDSVASGWVRPRQPGPIIPGAAPIAAMIDAFWPAGAARFESPRPLATITFGMQVMSAASRLSLETPVFYTARCLVSDDGYMVEERQIWSEDGRLLALNQQTMAIIK